MNDDYSNNVQYYGVEYQKKCPRKVQSVYCIASLNQLWSIWVHIILLDWLASLKSTNAHTANWFVRVQINFTVATVNYVKTKI